MDEQLANNCGGDELFTHCIELIKRLDSLKIVKEEYMLMKALILTNAGIIIDKKKCFLIKLLMIINYLLK